MENRTQHEPVPPTSPSSDVGADQSKNSHARPGKRRRQRSANECNVTGFHFDHRAISKTRAKFYDAGSGNGEAHPAERSMAYIETMETWASSAEPPAVSFSNISDDPIERLEFWRLVEKAESNPTEDVLKFRMDGNEAFWSAVARDRECPEPLALAITEGRNDEVHTVQTSDNSIIRRLVARYGWKPFERRPANETSAQKIAPQERERSNAFGAIFQDGRGGRIHFLVSGELPYEVGHEARVRIVKDFVSEFEIRKLPYMVVIRPPEPTMDDRNWRFHLVYHDRPAMRFTGLASDHFSHMEPGTTQQTMGRYRVAQKAIASDLSEQIGAWDFTVEFVYRKPNGNKMTATPFKQKKDRDCNNRAFLPMLRARLADLNNRELENANIARRVDPRRHQEIGIPVEANRFWARTNGT